MAVGRDLVAVLPLIRALEVAHEAQPAEAALDVRDGAPERRAVRPFAFAVDHHGLGCPLRERTAQGLVGAAGLTDARLVAVQGLGAERAAGVDGDHDERDPTPDRNLAVARAPATRAGGDVPGLHLRTPFG